ncbi:MAG: dynamin family protein [Oscillospiraceae bacterium]|nr:dynamin family protein [Oscillospiraceae bacterium]
MENTFFRLKNDARKLMLESGKLAEALKYDTSKERIDDIIKEFDKKDMMVVAVGEARRGKSSLLNALLNETETIFPVDLNVCTNVVTIVRYSETEQISALINDPSAPDGSRIERITRQQISEYVSEQGNPNNYKDVQCLDVAIPNEALKDGAVFVDTPGVGSLNPIHAEVTYSFLPNADLIIFVTDSLSGMTETELKFLERGYKSCPNIVFALTKKDLNVDYQEIANDNKAKIKSKISMEEEDIKILPVSSMAKLRYLSKGNKSMYKNSGFIEFEKTIWDTIAKTRAKSVILPFIVETEQELNKISNNIVAQHKLLSSDKENTGKLIEKLQKEIDKLQQFDDESAEWRTRLNLSYMDISNDATDKIQKIGNQTKKIYMDASNQLGVKICKAQNYTQVLQMINQYLSECTISLRDDILYAFAELIERTNMSLGLDIDIDKKFVDRIQFVSEDPEIRFRKKTVSEQVISRGRTISLNTGGITTITSIIGGIAGFIFGGGPVGITAGTNLGAVIGAVIGAGNAATVLISRHDMTDVSAVNTAFNQMISSQTTSMTKNVNRALAELKESLISDFAKKIRMRKTETQQNINRSRENINLKKNEIPQKRAALKEQNDRINAQLNAIIKMEKAIETFSPAPVKQIPVIPAPRAEEEEKKDNDPIDYGFI